MSLLKQKTKPYIIGFLLSISLLLFCTCVYLGFREYTAQSYVNSNEYHLRYSKNIAGGIVFTGNTNGLSLSNDDNTLYNQAQNGFDGIGVYSSLNSSLQVQGYPQGTTKNWRENGSTANLQLPTGSVIDKAILIWGANSYWGANLTTPSQSITQAEVNTPVTFTTSTGQHSIAPDPQYQYIVETPTPEIVRREYSNTADVTSLVQQSGSGVYSVQGIPGILATEMINGVSADNIAGWTLAVVYKNYNESIKNITLYTGSQLSNGRVQQIEGFSSPSQGGVKGKLHVSAFEGDAGLTGDQLNFGSTTTNLTALSGPNNQANNFFASQINGTDGNLNTTGTNGSLNTDPSADQPLTRHGWDITAVDISPSLTNSQTSAYIQTTSSGDQYIVNALGVEIEVNAPLISTVIAVDKPTTTVGDILTYTVTITNNGSTDSLNTLVTSQIPAGTSYIQDSLTATPPFTGNNPLTGVNFGTLEIGESIQFTYKVKVDSIPPSLTFSNQARTDFEYKMTPESETISDSDLSNTVITTISNQAPINAIDDVMTTNPNTPITIDVLVNDSINGNSPATIVIKTPPANGTVHIKDGKIIYTPNQGFSGNDSFGYEVCNANGCDTATVKISVPRPAGQVLGANSKNKLVPTGGLPSLLLIGSLLSVSVICAIISAVILLDKDRSEVTIDNNDSEY